MSSMPMIVSAASANARLAAAFLCLFTAYGYQLDRSPLRPSEGRGRDPYYQTLRNYRGFDLQYTGEVTIGNQTLQGVLDTGSFELLVFSSACDVCGSKAKLFNASESPTHSKGRLGQSHVFGSGTAFCTEALEHVTIGPLEVPNISLWEVNNVDLGFGMLVQHSDFQAIVGVGPPGVPQAEANFVAERDQEKADWWEEHVHYGAKAMQAKADASERTRQYVLQRNDSVLKILGTTTFSVCLGKEPGSSGHFIWDDTAHDLHPHLFAPVQVVGEYTWGTQLSEARLWMPIGAGGSSEELAALGGAIVDSGTSLLVVPSAVAAKIRNALDSMDLDCARAPELLPHLSFKLDGKEFTLPPDAFLGYSFGVVPQPISRWFKEGPISVRCNVKLLIMTEDAETQFGPLWIIGMPFFRQYYTTFHLGLDFARNARTLYVAPAADSGRAPAGADGVSLRSEGKGARSVDAAGESAPLGAAAGRLRTVDLSHVRVPHWVSVAFSKGKLRI